MLKIKNSTLFIDNLLYLGYYIGGENDIMKYKMIVSDFDGTFIRDDFTYSKALAEGVKRYTQKGGKFMFATGRMTCSIKPYCLELGLKGELVKYQGASIEDIESGNRLFSCPIAWETALEVGEWIEKQRHYYQLYDFDKFITEHHTEYTDIYKSYSCFDPIILGQPITKYIKESKFDPIKMMIMTEPENVQAIIDQMQALFGDKLLFNTSLKWLVEMININTNKGRAVEWVAKRNGIKREEIICIGDASNDADMIKYAGLGVVVENGSAYAKRFADEIAPSNNQDGVLHIIKKYGLEE